MRDIIVGVDFDDTLANSNPAIIEWHNITYNTRHVPGKDGYNLAELWQIPRHEAERRFEEYVESPAHDQAEPILFARKALDALKVYSDVVLVTGRRTNTERRTLTYLNAHFPEIFSDLVFTNHYPEQSPQKRFKGDVCRELKIDWFVEDAPVHATNIAETSPHTQVLLLDTIWNQGFSHPRILRVSSWREAHEIILEGR